MDSFDNTQGEKEIPQGFISTIRLLLQDMKETKRFSDVTLVTLDNFRIKCHKVVLALCSPVLRRIFTDLWDIEDIEIVLPFAESTDLYKMLDILYTGSTDITSPQNMAVHEIFNLLQISRNLSNDNRSVEIVEQETCERNEELSESSVEFHSLQESQDDNFERLRIVEDETAQTGDGNIMEELHHQNLGNHGPLVDIVRIKKVPDPLIAANGEKTITRFICSAEKCRKSFSRKYDLMAHNRTHTGERPYACQFCEERFISVTDMRRHMLKDHNYGEKVACKLCGKTFRDSHNLKSHMSVHTGTKPFACIFCPSAFSQKSDLVKHAKIHSDIHPFKCDVCERGFKWKHILRRHKLTHTGEKKFECGVCGYKFRQNSDLNLHKRIHTGEKKFSCKFCHKKFGRNDYLTKHLSIHRKPSQNLCPVPLCNSTFVSNEDQRKHMQTQHTSAGLVECPVIENNSANEEMIDPGIALVETNGIAIQSGEELAVVEEGGFAVVEDEQVTMVNYDEETTFLVSEEGEAVAFQTEVETTSNVAVEIRKDVVEYIVH